jgi:hypothetical protein
MAYPTVYTSAVAIPLPSEQVVRQSFGKSLPVTSESHATYACASSQLTLITGRCPRPQPWSFGS